jgi:cellulose synthase/poly-beta-1,6-N-acetylglucosamine synthase-like glycosyltransferase
MQAGLIRMPSAGRMPFDAEQSRTGSAGNVVTAIFRDRHPAPPLPLPDAERAIPAPPTVAGAGPATSVAPCRPGTTAEPRSEEGFGPFLVSAGFLGAEALRRASALCATSGARIAEVVAVENMMTPRALVKARALWHGLPIAALTETPGDPRLIDRIGAERCIAWRIVPLSRRGSHTPVAIADPALYQRHRAAIAAACGPIRPLMLCEDEILAEIERLRAGRLRRLAETRVADAESCRSFSPAMLTRGLPLAAAFLVVLLWVAPGMVLAALTGWAALSLGCTVALRAAALAASMRPPPRQEDPPLAPRDLPVISVIVPLYRETDIAPRLLRRLGRIDYPRARLDVILAVEEDDRETRAALARAALPRWMHVVTVPDGPLKTKPRALNYALPFARGSIIGIYDAEDAPAPDQLRKVAARFASAPAEVGCLQGILDYYNPRTNWIARCFTLEYAIWFRVVMPGLERLGVPLPLGGTTLFVRRGALEAVGAWDAHNVTEDADLGIRLAANGYRTEMLPSTTEEEANCRPKAWIRQRSRWIKGHMLTWAVHMRRPGRLRRAVGWRGFIGYQIVFFGAQSQFLLAPVLWSFWLIAAGVNHPAAAIMPPTAFGVLIGLVVAAEALGLVLAVRAGRMTQHAGLWLWAPTLHLYFPLATFAAWRAAAEIVRRPFYWAKTSHGHFDTTLAAPDAPANPPGGAAAVLSAS